MQNHVCNNSLLFKYGGQFVCILKKLTNVLKTVNNKLDET